MNPSQDPQQPPATPPTPEQTPQPFNPQASITPTNQPDIQAPAESSEPVAPTSVFPTIEPEQPFSSEGTYTPTTNTPKKSLNKKLLIIIGVIVAVIALGVIALLIIKPWDSTNGTLSGSASGIVSTSQLAEYKGANFTINYPKNFKSVSLPSDVAGSENIKFNVGGHAESDYTRSSMNIIWAPFPSDKVRNDTLKSYEESTSSSLADTDTVKDLTSTKITYKDFKATKITATGVEDGKPIYKLTQMNLFSDKSLAYIVIRVVTADQATIGAEVDNIIASYKEI